MYICRLNFLFNFEILIKGAHRTVKPYLANPSSVSTLTLKPTSPSEGGESPQSVQLPVGWMCIELQWKKTINSSSSTLSNVVYLILWRNLRYIHIVAALLLLGCCCSYAVCGLFKISNIGRWLLAIPELPTMSK